MIHRRAQLPLIWLLIASTLILCSGVSAIWLTWQQRAAEGWVDHTFEVENTLSELRIAEMNVELQRRDYLISGSANARRRYSDAFSRVPLLIDKLALMTADNPRQVGTIPVLRTAVARWAASEQKSMRLGGQGTGDRAAKQTETPITRRTTSHMMAVMALMLSEEERLLTQRQNRSLRLQSLERSILVISLALLAVLMAVILNDRKRRIQALQMAYDEQAADIITREEAERQLSLLTMNITDAVHKITPDGICIYASPSVESLIGIKPEALIGTNILSGIHPDDIVEIKEQLAALCASRISRAIVTYRVRKSGSNSDWAWFEANVGLVSSAELEAPLEIIASVRDVSVRKQLEIELEAARNRAESAVRAKAAFLANMSHEIRTPMNGVIGFTDLVLSGALTATQRRQVELIAESGRAMMRLLNDILDLSKIEASHLKLNIDPLDIRHVLRSCISLMGGSASAKNLALASEVADEVPEWILADGLRIRQVVLNLLGNALKFTSQGQILVRALFGEGMLRIEVRDTGVGIAPARQAAIFKEFVQGSDTTARDHGGTGLGLAISNGLVRLMGGSLTIDSELGRGSCFSFTLEAPRCEKPSQITGTDRGGVSERRRSARAQLPERILLVEDHDINQELMVAMLHRANRVVDVADDGASAITMVQKAQDGGSPYDIVLMDMQMPVMGGVDATKAIRALGFGAKQLPIIALTANAYLEDVETCLAAGMQAHLAKPINAEKLEETISAWCAPKVGAQEDGAYPVSASVRAKYDARKKHMLEMVAELIRNGAFTDESVTAVANELHKLSGTAGLFGEQELGVHARDFEDGLRSWPTEERVANAAVAFESFRQAVIATRSLAN